MMPATITQGMLSISRGSMSLRTDSQTIRTAEAPIAKTISNPAASSARWNPYV